MLFGVDVIGCWLEEFSLIVDRLVRVVCGLVGLCEFFGLYFFVDFML